MRATTQTATTTTTCEGANPVGLSPGSRPRAEGLEDPAGAALSLARTFRYVFLLLTAGALLSASTYNLEHLREGRGISVFYPLLWEFTGWYGVLPFVPVIHWASWRWPIRRATWRSAAVLHLALAAGISLAHTTFFCLLRIGLYRWLDLGDYDPGILVYRYLFELHKFIVVYAGFQGLSWLYRYTSAQSAREAAAARLAQDLAEARLESLKTQINPHFLFNALNTISSVMYEDVRLADRLISRLSELMRETLGHTARHTVSLAEELRILDLYVQIMRARFGPRLEVRVEVASDCALVDVPAFLLQPLVENAIKHHRAAEAGATIIVHVRAWREEATLHVAVEDNGPGLRDDARDGVGLTNLRARLAHLYGAAGRLVLENRAEGGLGVHLRIPSSATLPPEGEAA
jgi:two-component system, LytTR family, sensor kinase